METREILELMLLSNFVDDANTIVIDGRRIIATQNGTCYDFDKIEQRATELLFKLLEPYKIKK